MTREEAIEALLIMLRYEDDPVKYLALKMAIKALEQPEPCEDAISRRRLLSRLKTQRNLFCKSHYEFKSLPKTDKARVDEIDSCIAEVLNAPSVTPKEPQWIPCSERLPDKEGNYLITAQPTYNHAKDIRIAHWSGRWVGYVKSEIIAWMPLPEPYAERRTDAL